MALDAGGGAGDRRERFVYMQVPAMWAMLQFHDSSPHYQALEGWRRSYELVLMHRTQVEKYKEKLITAWPPERSKASYNYVERLNHLIESLTETYEASIANHTAYSSALAAVDDIKRKMDTIQQEHATNATALSNYEEELRNRPRAYGKAVAPPPPPSPVADGRQEELRLQAASLMTGLTAELATAQTSLTAPRPYAPLIKTDNSGDVIETGGGGASLPPITPSWSGRAASTPRTSRASLPTSPARGNNTTPGSGKGDLLPSSRPSVGPILGGTKQPANPPSTGNPSIPSTVTPTTTPPDSFNFTPNQGPPSTGSPRYPSTIGTPVGGTPIGTNPAAGARGNSPLNGGIIGGTPPIGGSSSGRPGQLGAGTRGTTQRINPLGGMIGQNGATPPGRRTASRGENETNLQHWDPDNPWETEIGIDPVLHPRPEQRINPGPTIGGR